MTLYEVTNGYTGESYVRVYVWAETEPDAIALARAAYETNQQPGQYDPRWSANLDTEVILDLDGLQPGATPPSDAGWRHDR